MTQRLGGDPPTPWESLYGYCRVIRTGDLVFLAGITSATADGAVIGDSPYQQAVEILNRLEHELGRVGVTLAGVIQNRCYVTDISRADEVGRAHGERFAEIRPVMTMVQVSALIDPRMLVEIETVARVA